MKPIRLKFPNKEGLKLGARLELPVDGKAENYAIFAHCFTCNKNLLAVRNISRALTQNRMGVLLFDFAGLGESEGEFEDTNFSSNISDLIAAAKYLEEHYRPPQLLIGHSLGGAAVIQAAAHLPKIKAVATIGAPADPPHVAHLFQEELSEIDRSGQATVNIGGRPFVIKKQFIDDLEKNPMPKVLKDLDKSILIMHSPQDRIVGIANAANLYTLARHPKSFVSLDGADHLLTDPADSTYVGDLISSWAQRYLINHVSPTLETERQVVVRTGEGFTTEIKAESHALIADEPKSLGGLDLGPTPYGLLLASLGSCTGITLRMYADRKKWPLKEVIIHMQHEKRHLEDSENMDQAHSRLDHIDKEIELVGDLDDTQRERLLQIADRCPVHRTLQSEVIINSRLL